MSHPLRDRRRKLGDDATVDDASVSDRAVMLAVGGYPAWVALGGVLLLGALGSGLFGDLGGQGAVAWSRYLPLAASLVLFGLPHGAVDHLAPARAAGRSPSVRWLLTVGVVYLVLGVAYGVLWFASPVVAAAAFIAMTWFHWGQGDLYALDALGASHLDDRATRLGTLVVRGGLPMLVPLLGHPAQYRSVVDSWVALFGSSLDAAWLVSPTVRGALGGAFALLTFATLLVGALRGGGRTWRVDAAETVLLWAFFLLVPPIFAIGVYFCIWHSLRHIARLVAVDPAARRAFGERGVTAALARTGRDALPLTVLSLGLLVGIAVVGGVGFGSQAAVQSAAAVYLVFISALTLPHVAIVTWMDWVETAGLGRLVREQ